MKYFSIIFILFVYIISAKAQSDKTINPTALSTVLIIDHAENILMPPSPRRVIFFRGNDTTIKNAAYYLAKSKHQNNTAWTLAVAGTVIIGAALLVGSGKEKTPSGTWDFGPSDKEVWTGILGVIGGGFVIASIPCFITGGVYKHKARVALRSQKTGFGIPNGSPDIPGFSLAFSIRK